MLHVNHCLKRFLFALAFLVPFAPPPAQAVMDSITNTNDSGANSFRQAIVDENGSTTTASATFSIGAGGSNQTIIPASLLPAITASNSSFVNTYNGEIILDGSNLSGGSSILLNSQASGVSLQGVYFGNLTTTLSDLFVTIGLTMTDGDIINSSTGMGAVYVAPNSAFNLHITSNYVSQNVTQGFNGNSTSNSNGGSDIYVDTGALATVNLDSGITYGFYDAQAIGGPGGLALQGSGTLLLPTANTYSGGTQVEGGTLVASNTGSLGTGGVTLTGGATLNLQGGIQPANSLFLDGCTLSSSQLNGWSGNVVAFSSSTLSAPTNIDTLLMTGNFTGEAPLSITGQGLVILDGSSAAYGGNIALGTGASLELGDLGHPSAVIGGNVSVASGATLMGQGTVNGTVTNYGTLVPGAIGETASSGAMTVATYIQGASGALSILVSGPYQTSLQCLGQANLNGALQVAGTPVTTAVRTDYVVVTASNGVSGVFAALSNSVTGFNSSLEYGSNSVTLTFTLPSAGLAPGLSSGLDPNAQSVMAVINQALPTASSDFVNIVQTMFDVRAQQATPAGQAAALKTILDNFLGQAQASNKQVFLFNEATGQMQSLQSLMDSMTPISLSSLNRFTGSGLSFDGAGPGVSSPGAAGGQGLWLDSQTSFGSTGSSALEAFNQNNEVVSGGYNLPLGGTLTGGFKASYLQSANESSDGQSRINTTGWQGALYAFQKLEGLDWAAQGSFGINQYQTIRNIFIGPYGDQAQGAYSGSQLGFSAQAGLPFKAGGLDLEPFLGAQWSHDSQNGFTETGAGALDLSVPAQSYDSLGPFLGVNGTKDFSLGPGVKLVPFAGLSASWDALDEAPAYQETLAGAPNSPFTVTGNKPDALLWGIQGGFKVGFEGDFNLFAQYNGYFNGSENLNTLEGGLNLGI